MIRFFSFLISITLFTAPTFAAWTPRVALGRDILFDPFGSAHFGIEQEDL